MSATTLVTINVGAAGRVPVFVLNGTDVKRKRRISAETERTLAMLGHAVEYLTDEYVGEGSQFKLSDPRIQAAIMLMQRSQEIYFACPEEVSLFARFRAWIGLQEA